MDGGGGAAAHIDSRCLTMGRGEGLKIGRENEEAWWKVTRRVSPLGACVRGWKRCSGGSRATDAADRQHAGEEPRREGRSRGGQLQAVQQ